MKILYIITGLNRGGAEIMLLKLLKNIDKSRFEPSVISLTSHSEITDEIEALGVKVFAINIKNPFNAFRLIKLIKEIAPDIVHTWMYHSDLIGSIAAYFAGIKNIAWCIRNSNLDWDKTKLTTIITVKICAALSRSRLIPQKIVSCSEIAKDIHINIGYDKTKFIVIPNGFELDKFRPNDKYRLKIRKELNIDDDTPLIGLIARFDPQKNHIGFINAAKIINDKIPNAKFLLVGKNIDKNNNILTDAIAQNSLENSFIRLGQRDNIDEILPALDLYISSSHGEAFPNVIGEAMACGVPCAATNAGESKIIIEDTGKIVKIDDMKSLADAAIELLSLSKTDRQKLGEKARKRVIENYDIKEIAKKYECFYISLIEDRLCAE